MGIVQLVGTIRRSCRRGYQRPAGAVECRPSHLFTAQDIDHLALIKIIPVKDGCPDLRHLNVIDATFFAVRVFCFKSTGTRAADPQV